MIYNSVRFALVATCIGAGSGYGIQEQVPKPLIINGALNTFSSPAETPSLPPVAYKAAVVQSANGYDLTHVYQKALEAKSNGAEIVIFPENGLQGDLEKFKSGVLVNEFGYSTLPQGNGCQDQHSPACTTWPRADPQTSLATDCETALAALKRQNPHVADPVRTAACIAKEVGTYVVINVGDQQECLKDLNGYPIQASCPAAGKVAFNTEVAFSPKGALVAKYYKHFLFNDAKTQPSQLILARMDEVYGTSGTFTAEFTNGRQVKFGLAICNDINSASLIQGYVNKGIKDIIVSDNWHNSFSLETITSISNGFTRTYGINMLVSSAGNGAGGSGIFSNGKTLVSDKLLIMDLGVYRCIDAATGTFTDDVDCVGRVSLATLTSGGGEAEALPAVVPGTGEAWPRSQMIATTQQGLGLPIPEILNDVPLQPQQWLNPGSTFKDPKTLPASSMIDPLQNVGNVDLLTDLGMQANNVYHFAAENNGVKCEVTATVKSVGAKRTAFKLLTVNNDVYVPRVPCPFQWNVCSFSRCATKDPWNQCRAGPIPTDELAEFTQFSEINVTMTTTQASITSPLIVGNQLQPLDSSRAAMAGDWNKIKDSKANMVYQLSLTEETMGTDGFGFASILGNNAADPHKKCDLCVNPDNFWDTSSAQVPTSDAQVRKASCDDPGLTWWGPGGPGDHPAPPPAPPVLAPVCFPSTAMVTKADGTRVPIREIKEGDSIVAATVEGERTTDTVSVLSIDKPDVKAEHYITLRAADKQLSLTPEHHVPVGEACCSEVKKAKDIEVGDAIWIFAHAADKNATRASVTQKSKSTAMGLHSPVLTHGSFPIVDDVVTSFDSAEMVALARTGLAALETACKATGTCGLVKSAILAA